MPGWVTLTNRQTGQDELVDADAVNAAIATGKYLDPAAVAVHRDGMATYTTPDVAAREAAFAPTIDPTIAAREAGHTIRARENSGIVGAGKAALGGVASGLSFGAINPWEDAQEFNPGASIGGQIVGALAPALLGDEASLLSLGRLGRGAALADDALTAERAASTLSSRALFAGEHAAGEAGELGRGLARAGDAVHEATAASATPAELATLDAKGLRAAHAAELDAIEAGRVPQRAALANDLAAFRAQARDDKLFLVTKGIKEDGIGALGKRTLTADRQLDRLLDNPIRLAQEPERALAALQQQDAALEGILAKADKLRMAFAADETGARAATLDKIPAALERNRALQARIAELAAEPASERLTAIAEAQTALSAPKPPLPPSSMAEQALSGTAFGAITGAAHAIPLLGQIPGVAHFIGAKASKLVTDLVFGKLGGAAAEVADRSAAAAEKFLDVSKTAAFTPTVPVLASKVLSETAFAPTVDAADAPVRKKLPDVYKQRSTEIRSQTMYDQTGAPVLRPEARQAIGDRLAGVRAVSPLLADKMETIAARRIEYLSSQLPRRPDMNGVPIGPDHWQPSDLDMRSWARKVAAIEDPHAVFDRLERGTITPEDVEAMRAVYPEMMADFTHKVLSQLPSLRATLPYRRQLALTMFTGISVDPAMEPQIIAMLQSQFPSEVGSAGGTQAPKALPQFGSIKKSIDAPTTAQVRAQGAHPL